MKTITQPCTHMYTQNPAMKPAPAAEGKHFSFLRCRIESRMFDRLVIATNLNGKNSCCFECNVLDEPCSFCRIFLLVRFVLSLCAKSWAFAQRKLPFLRRWCARASSTWSSSPSGGGPGRKYGLDENITLPTTGALRAFVCTGVVRDLGIRFQTRFLQTMRLGNNYKIEK